MTPIPFLGLQEREKFLREHNMIDDKKLSDEDRLWLETVNFHYLMGYARNYRAMARQRIVEGPKSFADIRSILDVEVKFSAFMMPWLRQAEWFLRALTVKHFCEKQGTGEGYLNLEKWRSHKDGDRELLQHKILDSIQRHPEPYVVDHIKEYADKYDLKPPDYSYQNRDTWLRLVENLPLWAVIDSFSIGTLGKFIMLCGDQQKGTNPVWKCIAGDLGITAKHFSTAVDSFAVTRNLIFHHQRLWMRPMSKSPGISKELQRKFKNAGFKSKNKQAQFIALLNISRFLPKHDRKCYLEALEEIVSSNELFRIGIMESPFPL